MRKKETLFYKYQIVNKRNNWVQVKVFKYQKQLDSIVSFYKKYLQFFVKFEKESYCFTQNKHYTKFKVFNIFYFTQYRITKGFPCKKYIVEKSYNLTLS